ncbi:LCCL domain-containing protein, related [Eimeria mitis]|uniref:LCCL domain-containing protein, related n=1 Tax=Eimeria mitis TaxID=44415 RepID=U6KGI8_9EIME|nr:LCCL domain-containing protein, related [Eimeria mitis]CDJ34583.1 LCCL domain-containing protein, related [Eimeria mitis]
MGSGSVGIGFRMKDSSSGYLLLLQQKSGSKKLLRLDRGEETTIAERRDGGYVQGEWHRVRIEAAGGRIKICVGEENETEAEVLTALDESFVSGTIAFFSSGMQDGVYFDALSVEAVACMQLQQLLPPLPPFCSVFVESYFSSVSALYTIIDGRDKGENTGRWEYREEVRGRVKVLSQLHAVRDAAEAVWGVCRWSFWRSVRVGLLGSSFGLDRPKTTPL